jgi:hypothetical protein
MADERDLTLRLSVRKRLFWRPAFSLAGALCRLGLSLELATRLLVKTCIRIEVGQ